MLILSSKIPLIRTLGTSDIRLSYGFLVLLGFDDPNQDFGYHGHSLSRMNLLLPPLRGLTIDLARRSNHMFKSISEA